MAESLLSPEIMNVLMYGMVIMGIAAMVFSLYKEQKAKRDAKNPEMVDVPRDAEERIIKSQRDLIRRKYNGLRPPKMLKISGDAIVPPRKMGYLFHVEALNEEYRIFWKRSRWLPGKFNTALVLPEQMTDLNGIEVVVECRGFEGIGMYDRYPIPRYGITNLEEYYHRRSVNGYLRFTKQTYNDMRQDTDWAAKTAIRGSAHLGLIELEKLAEMPELEAARVRGEQKRRTMPPEVSSSEISGGGS